MEKKLQQKESEWHHLKGQLRQYERERIELTGKTGQNHRPIFRAWISPD